MTICSKHILLIFPEEVRIEKTFILNIVYHSGVLFLLHVDQPHPIYFLILLCRAMSLFFFFFPISFCNGKKVGQSYGIPYEKKILVLIKLFQSPFS